MAILAAPRNQADFLLKREGGIMLFVAQSEDAKAKVPDLELESWQMIGAYTFSIDFRISFDLAQRLQEEGYTFADF
jgi:hypothetical protein